MIENSEIDRALAALDEALAIVRANNEALFVAHLFGIEISADKRTAPETYPNVWPVVRECCDIDARTAFVLHPTDLSHVREYFFPSLVAFEVADEVLANWWKKISPFLEPVHVRREVVRSNGFAVESNLIMVPYLPSSMVGDLSRRSRSEVRDKIQDAVTLAKELGDDNIPVTMVGLGAYTSIATCNGLTLNDHEMAVTTGNAYTTALTLEGIEHAARSSNINLGNAHVAVIGANGNIGQILSVFLAGSCRALKLLGSSRSDSLVRLHATREACLARFNDELSQAFVEEKNVARPRKIADISCHVDSEVLKHCDVVILATSSPNRDLIKPEHLKSGAIVCCTSLPSNLSEEFESQPNNIVTFAGGLASLPGDSSLSFVGLPKNGLSFGCLAETLLLGFDGHNRSFCKGRITVEHVNRCRSMAELYGFTLGALRLGDKSSVSAAGLAS